MTSHLKNFLADEGCYTRSNPANVIQVLEHLGIQPRKEFVDFFQWFEGPFSSEHNSIILSDLMEGGQESITNLTADLHKEHGFDARFLVVASIDGGDSALIYDWIDDLVYHMDFEGSDKLLKNGELNPRWCSFNDFLEWYFFGNGVRHQET